MAVLRPGRFTTGPAGTGKMLTSHAAPAAAVEDAFPMLIEMPLAKAGDQRRTRWLAPGLTRQRAGGVAGPRHPAGRSHILARPRHRDRIRGGRCMIARDPVRARTWQILAAGAMRTGGPG